MVMQKKYEPGAPSVGVVGGSGYTGRELLRLLARHGGVDVAFATSRSLEGKPSPVPGLLYSAPDEEQARSVDVVFLCLPHGSGADWVERLRGGPRIIDLTTDHRPGSGRENGAVYGLAELAAGEVASADLVANPGCYPTGVILSLKPLHAAGLIDEGRLTTVSAASGVTGAGRSPKPHLLFAEVAGNFRAYGEGNQHRHLREMNALLEGLPLLFQPHLLPVSRGILETIVVPVRDDVGPDEIRQAWRMRYGTESAVRILDEGLPELSQVVETDLLLLGVSSVEGISPPVVTVVAALDNLGKGAAGQALQNLNSMMGWPMSRGIRCAQ
jgi:N-acetyl-gamma-glutamyl-phosphate reductase